MPTNRWNDDRLDSFLLDFKKLDAQVEVLDRMVHENKREVRDLNNDRNSRISWWILAATWASPITTFLVLLLKGKS